MSRSAETEVEGYIKLAVVAARHPKVNGRPITQRCLKRRLKKKAAMIRAEHPNENALLQRFSPNGPWHLDVVVARRHLPGLVEGHPDDRIRKLEERQELVFGVLNEILSHVLVIRRSMRR